MEERENKRQERGQGLRLQRGSGELGTGKRIDGELKTLRSLSAGRKAEEKEEEGHLLA